MSGRSVLGGAAGAGEGRGLQRERTLLAWNRAALALAANGALVLRSGIEAPDAGTEGLGAALVLIGIALALVSLLDEGGRLSRGRPLPGRVGAIRALAALMLLVTLLDLAALALGR